MLRSLRVQNFKSFEDATLALGDFTAVVGANASGKSNLRDALRFVHGISRGYTLAEVIGEKWGEGGVLQWRGVRGGTRQIVRSGASDFRVTISFDYRDEKQTRRAEYMIRVGVGGKEFVPRVKGERLTFRVVGKDDDYVFNTHPDGHGIGSDPMHVWARVRHRRQGAPPNVPFLNTQPVISQLAERHDVPEWAARNAAAAMRTLASMRFLDLSPEAARQPSLAGLTTLGDRGENLSSVLQAIDAGRAELAHWVAQLTPMDVRDIEFESDLSGRVLAVLVEDGGRRTPLTTASDGTVRFLAIIASLLGPEPARFNLFEEIENGIHPNRLFLLLDLLGRTASAGAVQVMATTHSPELSEDLRTLPRAG